MLPSLCLKVRLRAKLLTRKIMGRSKPLDPLEWWVIYLKTYNFILFALNTSCTGKGVFVFFFNGNGLHDMFGFGWVPTSDMVKVKLKLETIIYFAYAFLFMCMKKSMFFMISHAGPPTNNLGQANGTFSNRTQSNSPQYLFIVYCLLFIVYCLLFIVLFAKNCTNQRKSNYLNSHGEEAQKKPRAYKEWAPSVR